MTKIDVLLISTELKMDQLARVLTRPELDTDLKLLTNRPEKAR